MSASTAWTSRPVPTALTPEKLAAWVDRSIARTDGMLFTATPTEELDAFGRWQQLKDQAFAGLMREIVASYNRASAQAREFAADEVGLAVGATTTTGGNLVEQALRLAELPGLLEAVESGQLTERHVLAVLRELHAVELWVEQRQSVVLVMLAGFRGQAPGELARVVQRLIVQVDRAAAVARERTATADRRVWFGAAVDGQATVTARGPAAQIAAIRAALDATLPIDPEDGDERSRSAREFDLLVDLLTGGTQAGSWHAEIVVPFSAAVGGELELADIPGLGPVLPATARDLLDGCDTVAQTAIDEHGAVIAVSDPISTDMGVARPFDGHRRLQRPVLGVPLLDKLAAPPVLRDLTGAGYRFPPRLRRLLEARDRTCVFPGCGRPAMRTDKDHRIPWPAGATSARNGQCLCRHHHRAKQTVFTVLLDDNGDHVWFTRGGWQFRRHPKGF
jgi:hypothetical protein